MEVLSVRGIRFASNLGFRPMIATKNFLQSTYFIRCADPKHWELKLSEKQPHYRSLSCNYVPFFNRINAYQVPLKYKFNKNVLVTRYCQSKACKEGGKDSLNQLTQKMTVFARIKEMTKDYWHVVIPVHLITSLGWLSIFYIAVSNGVNIVKILEYVGLGETFLNLVQNSNAGTWALVYILYKLATPFRYTLTLGCSTMTIKQFKKSGLIKPMPLSKLFKTAKSKSNQTTTTSKTPFKVERQAEPPKT